ncbi:MAG: LarC family nickel insertion protein [Anaerococcus sp.]|nr:LarC family nickel insertion protein [Anaerococcus sp.]
MDLYFEMYSGIAGDMAIGALLDLGASKEKLVEGIKALGLEGYDLSFARVKKNGIDAYDFDVNLEAKSYGHKEDSSTDKASHGEDGHCHGKGHHNHGKGKCHHNHHEESKCCHSHHHEDHTCDHGHHKEDTCRHSHHHGHGHHHDHHHRNLEDIKNLINSSSLSDRVKKDSLGIFEIIGQAEARAHGIDINEVHFHEVGAIDSIIDIVGLSILLEDLGVDKIYFSKLYEGMGRQECAHGYMPVPVPAVANILKDSSLSLSIIDEEGEHITPTGMAIVKYFSTGESLEDFSIGKIGLGAGNKDFKKSTNILRVMEVKTKKKL